MIVIDKTGKTVEEAVELALKELNTDKENVKIEVIDEGNRGFLGLLGNKQAKIKVYYRTSFDYVKDFLDSIVKEMDLDVKYEINQTENNINVNFTGVNVGLLIGKRGETLDSVQYLCNLIANKVRNNKYMHVSLDAENYRSKREQSLIKLAHKMALRAEETRKNIILEPMTPYERKIIHMALQNDSLVETYSQGEEPYRKVVIALK